MSTLITASGSDDLSAATGWGDVPPADRAAWSRYMLDYCPWFPGITMMLSFVAPGILAGGSGAPLPWKEYARSLHVAGFAPADYYLLCQELELRLVKGGLVEAEHGDLFEKWGNETPYWGFALLPSVAEIWLLHLRNGRSPRRAPDYILSKGNPPPMGRSVAPSGTLGDPIGD